MVRIWEGREGEGCRERSEGGWRGVRGGHFGGGWAWGGAGVDVEGVEVGLVDFLGAMRVVLVAGLVEKM
jgi:hypothetical protein